MSFEFVWWFFVEKVLDLCIIELEISIVIVVLVVEVYGVELGWIVKILLLWVGECIVLVVVCGDVWLDNCKIKVVFGGKVKMFGVEDVVELIGYLVGGVCLFGLVMLLVVYCDVLL